MKYIYNGTLSRQRVEWLTGMLDKYPYAVEVDSSGINHDRFRATMPKHTYWKEGDMGGGGPVTGNLYSCVSRDDSDDNDIKFYCFLSEKERQIFCKMFSEHVIDANPFKTEFAA